VDTEAVRSAALIAAAGVAGAGTQAAELTAYADQLIPWITAPPAVRLDVTVTIDGALIAHSSNGGDMAFTAVAGVNTTFTVTVTPKDAQDNTTADAISFSTDDPSGAILTPSVSADGYTWTGMLTGTLGTVNLTATDPAVPSVAAYTAQLIVQAGPTTHLVGTVTVT
jgi:hypothetical protein